MVDNPPKDMARVNPYLYYNNLEKARNWLAEAFGLTPRFSMPGEDGALMHVEMTIEDGVVMMGKADAEQGAKSPQDLQAVTQGIFVYVDDVDAHFTRAKRAGAQIMMEPEEMFWGDRIYSVVDVEGHQWTFAQHIKDVPPEQMVPPQQG